jgi:hypothetical protein
MPTSTPTRESVFLHTKYHARSKKGFLLLRVQHNQDTAKNALIFKRKMMLSVNGIIFGD